MATFSLGCRPAATDRTQPIATGTSRPAAYFDLILGNPPFGGSINAEIQDELDAVLGFRNGKKIKKETYAFFLVKSVDLLKPGGHVVFICSDTILTIATMTGLRSWLQANCAPSKYRPCLVSFRTRPKICCS